MTSPSLKILVQFAQHLPLYPRVFAQTASCWIFYPDVKLGLGPPLCCYIPAKGQGSVSSTCSATLSPAELIMGSAHWLPIAINFSAVFILTWPPWMCLVLFTLTDLHGAGFSIRMSLFDKLSNPCLHTSSLPWLILSLVVCFANLGSSLLLQSSP